MSCMNVDFLENLYQEYQTNPSQIDPSWHHYFDTLEYDEVAPKPSSSSDAIRLIEAYRQYGHLAASTNPINLKKQEEPIQLRLGQYGFQESDLEKEYFTHGLLPQQTAKLRIIIEKLRSLYCDGISYEFKHAEDPGLIEWMQKKIESEALENEITNEDRKLIIEYLNKAELLDAFLHTKYVGQKRFSIEGAETFIPMLGLLIEKGAQKGLEEIILGMAHRGRLNVMSNLLNKSYKEVFAEFNEEYSPKSFFGTGDVKYHKGYVADAVTTQSGKTVKVVLTPNPSHLESVDAVVEGQVRAKQQFKRDDRKEKTIPILVHGDAALAGQGMVYEVLQLGKLRGYSTGGTIHFVINNQIGFTTIPKDLYSTRYCTDIAKTFGAPVIHVNAEDPDNCIRATLLAYEIRQRFKCDVFIDLNCYRKYGHNESDEPMFTQPLEYKLIKSKKPIRELYRDYIITKGVANNVIDDLEASFKKGLQNIHSEVPEYIKIHQVKESSRENFLFSPCDTKVSEAILKEVATRLSDIPSNFKLHPKLEHLVQERKQMVLENKPIDWGMGETLAYATLLWEKVSIRISGQDCCRGTFSHRHAIWVDQSEEKEYFPLTHLKEGQGHFEIYNSSLSELAVLGFEYGYSVAAPQALTIWEAQFGDFVNGAQVIIDQYIASGEQKWGQQVGLVLLLPHGYEGQGPEHSSARMERFLSLAGHDNMIIVNPTTPAQLFHLLRRQILKPMNKPLIVFTPKGLLRHPRCVSSLNDFSKGCFQDCLDDPQNPLEAKRMMICSGRIYYDLMEKREKEKRNDIILIRIEQLYPLNKELLKQLFQKYSAVTEYYWVQEEHKNMGAWTFIRPNLEVIIPQGSHLNYIGREISATPATGSHQQHKEEYELILNQVFKS